MSAALRDGGSGLGNGLPRREESWRRLSDDDDVSRIFWVGMKSWRLRRAEIMLKNM